MKVPRGYAVPLTISLQEIYSPMPGDPNVLVALNNPPLEIFQNHVILDGIILVNSSELFRRKIKTLEHYVTGRYLQMVVQRGEFWRETPALQR